MGAGQEKGQEARKDDDKKEMGCLSSALPEMVTDRCGRMCWDAKNRRDDGGGEGKTTEQQNARGREQLRQAEVWAQGEGEQWAGAEPLGAREPGSFSRSRAQQARLSVS